MILTPKLELWMTRMLATINVPESLPTTLQTVEEFEQWERLHYQEGDFEFVGGRIIPKPATKQDEFDMADFLLRQFIQTPQFQQKHLLLSEGESYIDGKRKLYYGRSAWRKRIYAYTSPLDIHVFANDDVVTANPVLPELTFSLSALFA
jgi:hypothetical protein